ncbi:CLUMA_CG012319, isoform A [Clunio marinus]|uniref:CLUMA_CG012319, isoform A n=1 Tax=Clunio marinus TaxID=568069 RepID=A0A1J1IH55_9DIPT|nr:CLUMA_CG012319, isoform A [Clunio marinus]
MTSTLYLCTQNNTLTSFHLEKPFRKFIYSTTSTTTVSAPQIFMMKKAQLLVKNDLKAFETPTRPVK